MAEEERNRKRRGRRGRRGKGKVYMREMKGNRVCLFRVYEKKNSHTD